MAVDNFLELEGIDGEAQDAANAGQIDVMGWQWGIDQPMSGRTGKGAGGGKVNVQDIVIQKVVDKSSSPLLKFCCKNTAIKTATLKCRIAGDDPLDLLVIKMANVTVASVAPGGADGQNELTETIALHFKKFEVNYQPQDEAGAADGGTVDMTWNIDGNTETW